MCVLLRARRVALTMMDESDRSNDNSNDKPAFDGTTIDLGEDLLQATQVLQRRPEPEAAASPQIERAAVPDETANSIEDDLQRGEILLGERLLDDAKKVFRKVLRSDPGSARARQFLEEIQKLEIQDLLGSDSPRKRFVEHSEPDSVDEVVERLERDLGIDIDKASANLVSSLFPSSLELDRYNESVLRTVTGLPPRERIDVGIAYLEMGLAEVARSIFESVVRYEDYKLEGTYLLGLALIQSGKAIEATLRLEPVVRDITLSDSNRADFLYLMATAFEALSDNHKAREFYRRVYALNPRYRDVIDKLR